MCTLAVSSFLLYLYAAFLYCSSQLSRAFIVSQRTFAWLEMWLHWPDSSIFKHKPFTLFNIKIFFVFLNKTLLLYRSAFKTISLIILLVKKKKGEIVLYSGGGSNELMHDAWAHYSCSNIQKDLIIIISDIERQQVIDMKLSMTWPNTTMKVGLSICDKLCLLKLAVKHCCILPSLSR